MPHERQMGVQDKAEISDGHKLAINSLQKVADSWQKVAGTLQEIDRKFLELVKQIYDSQFRLKFLKLSGNYLSTFRRLS